MFRGTSQTALLPATINRVAGVYVSYPFCAQKCTYCNFASGVFPAALKERYLIALADEIRAHVWEWTPQTVYLAAARPAPWPRRNWLRSCN